MSPPSGSRKASSTLSPRTNISDHLHGVGRKQRLSFGAKRPAHATQRERNIYVTGPLSSEATERLYLKNVPLRHCFSRGISLRMSIPRGCPLSFQGEKRSFVFFILQVCATKTHHQGAGASLNTRYIRPRSKDIFSVPIMPGVYSGFRAESFLIAKMSRRRCKRFHRGECASCF